MASNPNKRKKGKLDITLMTVLANEATAKSRKLLKQYGEDDAKDYNDLEVKLAELYFKTPDKVKLEKELASIHPHKNWILKNTEPIVKKEEITIVEPIEKKSNMDDNDCPTSKTPCHCSNCRFNNQFSSFDGDSNKNNSSTGMEWVGPVGMLAIIGMTWYLLSSQISKHN